MAYVLPRRNPLRRLPVRHYRGVFRNPLPGLGQTPIDIGTSATVTVTPTGDVVTGQGASAGYSAVTGPAMGSLTDWLNSNSSTLLWVGGIALGVLLLSKMAR